MKSKLGGLYRDFSMTALDFALQITLNLVLLLTTAGGDSEQRCGSRHTPQWGCGDGISALGAPRAWEAPL